MTADTRTAHPTGALDEVHVTASESRAPRRDDAGATFEALAAKYARLIAFVVSRVSRGHLRHSAQDVEQDILIALWKRSKGEQTIDYPSSYIYKAAVRETVRAVRREAARRVLPLAACEASASTLETASQGLESREIREKLERALGLMQSDRALAVRLHLQGLTVEEIMKLHRWPYQKSRNLIARGMADLRGLLSEEPS